MSWLNGVVTALAFLTFLGIAWWAYSQGRSKANHDASMLPFSLPDEGEQAADRHARGMAGGAEQKKSGESHE